MLKIRDNSFLEIEKSEKSITSAQAKKIGDKLELRLGDFITSPSFTFFSFLQDEEKRVEKNSDDLVVSLKKSDEKYLLQSGNYVGKFTHSGIEFEIGCRFEESFLRRMLNFANDIFVDDIKLFGDESKKLDISRFILFYMFVQNLEKAFLLGIPKGYKNVKHHHAKVKGRVDINSFIKKDIPYKGKISSISREQVEIEEIVDVIYCALKAVEKEGSGLVKNILHVKAHLKEHRSSKFVSKERINKAVNSKVLENPIFYMYKKVLKFAKMIIESSGLENKKGKNDNHGFLINVAELFEIYMRKLLQNRFGDWSVDSPKIELYQKSFYARKIIPDVVMIKDEKACVFDVKYKKMQMSGRDQYGLGDVDRADFFQINTYMSYYNHHCNLVAGGLIYPMSAFEKERCHSSWWSENHDTHFVIDGIHVQDEIVKSEDEFLDRVEKLLKI